MKKQGKKPSDAVSEGIVLDYFVRFFGLRGYLPRVTVSMGTTRAHDCDAPGGLSVEFSSVRAAELAIRKGERLASLALSQIAVAHKLVTGGGHIALRQGAVFECPRCGERGIVSGDGSVRGAIFDSKCGS